MTDLTLSFDLDRADQEILNDLEDNSDFDVESIVEQNVQAQVEAILFQLRQNVKYGDQGEGQQAGQPAAGGQQTGDAQTGGQPEPTPDRNRDTGSRGPGN